MQQIRMLSIIIILLYSSIVYATPCSRVVALSPAIADTVRSLGLASTLAPSPKMSPEGKSLLFWDIQHTPWEKVWQQKPSHVFSEQHAFLGQTPVHRKLHVLPWVYKVAYIWHATQTIAQICEVTPTFQALHNKWMSFKNSRPPLKASFVVLYKDTLDSSQRWYAAGTNFHSEILQEIGLQNRIRSHQTAISLSTEGLLALQADHWFFVQESQSTIVLKSVLPKDVSLGSLPIKGKLWILEGKNIHLPSIQTLFELRQYLQSAHF